MIGRQRAASRKSAVDPSFRGEGGIEGEVYTGCTGHDNLFMVLAVTTGQVWLLAIPCFSKACHDSS